MNAQPFRILEFVFPQMTQLDFTGPHQVFSRLPGVDLHVVSPRGGEVESQEGLRFAGTERIQDWSACDLLFIPGGLGITQVVADKPTMARLKALASGAAYVTSVCTGSMILAAAGLLRGKRAASHWAWRDRLASFGAIPDAGRVVRDGNVITGGGVTAGIDFAFSLAAELAGADFAQTLQLMLEYAPEPPFHCGRPDIAGEAVLARANAINAQSLPARFAAFETAARASA
jgi:Transcriptional regulator containing an amidase domain and an AraC-type DNA-binding HTH domain